jgi:hypothetical protein
MRALESSEGASVPPCRAELDSGFSMFELFSTSVFESEACVFAGCDAL